jgi:hypothetical protein
MDQSPKELAFNMANSLAFVEELARELAKSDLFIIELSKKFGDKEVLAKVLREYTGRALYFLIVDTVKEVVAPELVQYINDLPEDKKISLVAEAIGYPLANRLAPELKDYMRQLASELVRHEIFIKTFATEIAKYASQSKLFRDRLLEAISDTVAKEFKNAIVEAVKANWDYMEKTIITVVKLATKELAERATREIGEQIVRKVKNNEELQNELVARIIEAVLNDKENIDFLVERAESELGDKVIRNVVSRLTEELVPKIAERILQDQEFLQTISERAKEELAKRVRRIA